MGSNSGEERAKLHLVPLHDEDPEESLDNLLPNALGSRGFTPKLRRDLSYRKGRGDTVLVRTPENPQAFPVYEMEWRAAQLMDGTRDLDALASALGRLGLGATPKLVRAFIKELQGYGFLEHASGDSADALSVAPSPSESMTAEEQQLLSAALTMRSKGDIPAAMNYLLAILEINPGNQYVESLLRELSAESAQPKTTPEALSELQSDTQETLRPEVGSVAQSKPARSRNSLVWFGVTGLLVGAVGLWVGLRLGSTTPPAAPTQDPETMAERPVKAPAAQTFEVRLEPVNSAKILSPTSGHLVFLQDISAEVAPGTLLATVLPKRQFQRLKRAQRELQRQEGSAKNDPVVRYFLEESRAQVKKLKTGLQAAAIVSPTRGETQPLVEPEAAVRRNDVVFIVADTNQLKAPLPSSTLTPHSLEPDQLDACQTIVAGQPVACRVELDEAGGTVYFENIRRDGELLLKTGDLVSVEIGHAPATTPAGSP